MNSLYNLFVSVCEKAGNSVALVFHNRTIDYNTLYVNVEKIYKQLLENGVKSGDIVGLSVKRSPNALAAMLATLRIGAAYMPFDPLQTKVEWSRMIEESKCKAVINDRDAIVRFYDGPWIELGEFDCEVSNPDKYERIEGHHLKNYIYVIYTSGSTGKAKGVCIRQESLYNLIAHGTKEIGLTEQHRIIAFSNFAFDMSVPEMIMPILIGMSIVILDDEEVGNPRLVRRQIQDHNVSTVLITPTRMNILLNCKRGTEFLQSVKYILFGAELISHTLIDKLKEACDAQIFNLYGPTETTAYLTYSNITDKEVIDIGTPIKNTFINLIDEDQNIIDGPGEGEIIIWGIGVADGYLSVDVKQAFRTMPELSDSYVYFTGDMAKRIENGDIVYLGRCDNQIKYRGFRLGLEGIEDTIRNTVKEIQDCVIHVYKDSDNEYLTMLYVAGSELEITEFKNLVADHLASYSIPIRLIRVGSLPLNKNSKIDRAAVAEIAEKYFDGIK